MPPPTVLPPSSALPLGPGVTVLARHPAGLLALSKPGGVRSHPNGAAADAGALLTVPYDEKLEAYTWTDPTGGTPWHLHLLHRLDAPTSGVLLLCGDAKLAAAVREAFATRAVEKTYLAAVFGAGERALGTWTDRLAVDRRGGQLRTRRAAGPQSEAAVTSVRCLLPAAGPFRVALLSLRPKTGRTHQLRVQCAARHLPIVGDATYGDFARNRAVTKALGSKDLCLHACKIELKLPWQGRDLHFSATAPTPAIFAQVRAGKED